MVSPPCSSHVLIPILSLQLLVLTITWSSAAPESGAPIPLRGEVGGNVTFRCPVDGRTLRMLYLQKGDLFVNGFHASRDVSSEAWANSRVVNDAVNATVNDAVLMFGLNVSHEGDYRFIFQYEGVGKAEPEVHFHLSVTANYSKPTLSARCGGDDSPGGCVLRCVSHGGYPASEITWRPPGGSKVVNSSQEKDPDTQTFNVSSAAYANCSDGPTAVSCSVGDAPSDPSPVCSPDDAPEPGHTPVAAVAVPVVLGLLGLLVLLVVGGVFYQKRQRAAAARSEGGGEERVEYSAVRGQEDTGNTGG